MHSNERERERNREKFNKFLNNIILRNFGCSSDAGVCEGHVGHALVRRNGLGHTNHICRNLWFRSRQFDVRCQPVSFRLVYSSIFSIFIYTIYTYIIYISHNWVQNRKTKQKFDDNDVATLFIFFVNNLLIYCICLCLFCGCIFSCSRLRH